MDGTGLAVTLALVVPYAGLAGLTAFGSRRRGNSLTGSAISGVFFPAAWVAWYVQDVLRPRRHG